MILLSGDGGWQDLETTLARRANQAGISVIGIDSARYFRERRTPEQLAHDIEAIVSVYGRAWHAHDIVLAGYSFGADALPFAWPRLSRATQRRTRRIVLLGLVPMADFRISIWEMLDIPSADDIPVAPALRALPKRKVVCIHGKEDETACTLPELGGTAVIALPGGHRFAEQFEVVADTVFGQLRQVTPHRRQ